MFFRKGDLRRLKNRICSVKSAYHFITSSAKPNPVDRNLNWIWDIQTLPKIKMLIWRSSHDCLQTRNKIFAHASPDLKICPKCVAQESTIHFLEIAFGPKEWSFQHTNFQIQNQANEFFYLCYEEKNHTSHPILISWSPSTQLFIKLNTNDSVMNNPCLVGAGGLMGDLNGKWIWDFSMHLGITTSV